MTLEELMQDSDDKRRNPELIEMTNGVKIPKLDLSSIVL